MSLVRIPFKEKPGSTALQWQDADDVLPSRWGKTQGRPQLAGWSPCLGTLPTWLRWAEIRHSWCSPPHPGKNYECKASEPKFVDENGSAWMVEMPVLLRDSTGKVPHMCFGTKLFRKKRKYQNTPPPPSPPPPPKKEENYTSYQDTGQLQSKAVDLGGSQNLIFVSLPFEGIKQSTLATEKLNCIWKLRAQISQSESLFFSALFLFFFSEFEFYFQTQWQQRWLNSLPALCFKFTYRVVHNVVVDQRVVGQNHFQGFHILTGCEKLQVRLQTHNAQV